MKWPDRYLVLRCISTFVLILCILVTDGNNLDCLNFSKRSRKRKRRNLNTVLRTGGPRPRRVLLHRGQDIEPLENLGAEFLDRISYSISCGGAVRKWSKPTFVNLLFYFFLFVILFLYLLLIMILWYWHKILFCDVYRCVCVCALLFILFHCVFPSFAFRNACSFAGFFKNPGRGRRLNTSGVLCLARGQGRDRVQSQSRGRVLVLRRPGDRRPLAQHPLACSCKRHMICL